MEEKNIDLHKVKDSINKELEEYSRLSKTNDTYKETLKRTLESIEWFISTDKDIYDLELSVILAEGAAYKERKAYSKCLQIVQELIRYEDLEPIDYSGAKVIPIFVNKKYDGK